MRTGTKATLGLLIGAGALWGTRAYLRSKRRIELAGRVVVITGSSSGLGFLMAKDAAAEGAIVVLNARDAAELARAETEVRHMGAADTLAIPADVGSEDEAGRLIRETLTRFGRIDVLINNAGTILVGPEVTHTLDDYRRLMATNFWGAVHCTTAALPSMRQAGSGRIANIISMGGLSAVPHMAAYNASKHALTGYTRSLRADLAREGILVTGVYPKTIRTGGHTHAWFKGDPQAEYMWFAAGDTLPVLSASAEVTSRKVLDAIRHGDPELIVGLAARLAMVMEALVPDWSAELKALIESRMPYVPDSASPAVRGSEIEGRIAKHFHGMVPNSTRPG